MTYIAKNLLKESELAAPGRRFALAGVDLAGICQRIARHLIDDAAFIEMNGENVVASGLFVKKGTLLRVSRDIIPDAGVESAG